MSTQNRVDTSNTARHLEVDIHAVMRQHDYGFRTIGACVIDRLLHVFFFDAKGPVFNEVTRISNGRVRECLADDGNLDAVHFTHCVCVENRIFKICRLDILRDKVDLSIKIFFDNFLDPCLTERHFPMGGHHINAQG